MTTRRTARVNAATQGGVGWGVVVIYTPRLAAGAAGDFRVMDDSMLENSYSIEDTATTVWLIASRSQDPRTPLWRRISARCRERKLIGEWSTHRPGAALTTSLATSGRE